MSKFYSDAPTQMSDIEAVLDTQNATDAQIFAEVASSLVQLRGVDNRFFFSAEKLPFVYTEFAILEALNPGSMASILGDQRHGVYASFMKAKKEAAKVARKRHPLLSVERWKTHANYSARVVSCVASLLHVLPTAAPIINETRRIWNSIASYGSAQVHPDGSNHVATSNYVRRGAKFFIQLLEQMCWTVDQVFRSHEQRTHYKGLIAAIWIKGSYLSTFNWGNNKYRELLPSDKWQKKGGDFRRFHDEMCKLLVPMGDLNELEKEMSVIVGNSSAFLWKFVGDCDTWTYWVDEVSQASPSTSPEPVLRAQSTEPYLQQHYPPNLDLKIEFPTTLVFEQFITTPVAENRHNSSYSFSAPNPVFIPSSIPIQNQFDYSSRCESPSISSTVCSWTESLMSDQWCLDAVDAPFDPCPQDSQCRWEDESPYPVLPSDDSSSGLFFDFEPYPQQHLQPPGNQQDKTRSSVEDKIEAPVGIFGMEVDLCDDCVDSEMEEEIDPIVQKCWIGYCEQLLEESDCVDHLLECHLDTLIGRMAAYDFVYMEKHVYNVFFEAARERRCLPRRKLMAALDQFQCFTPPQFGDLKEKTVACIDELLCYCL